MKVSRFHYHLKKMMSNLNSCPICGGQVQNMPGYHGQMVSCPHCGIPFRMNAPFQGVIHQGPNQTDPTPAAPGDAKPNPMEYGMRLESVDGLATPTRRMTKGRGIWVWLSVTLVVVIGCGLLLYFLIRGMQEDAETRADVARAKERYQEKYSDRMPNNLKWESSPLYVAVVTVERQSSSGGTRPSYRVVEFDGTQEAKTRAVQERMAAKRNSRVVSFDKIRIGTLVSVTWETEENGRKRKMLQDIEVAKKVDVSFPGGVVTTSDEKNVIISRALKQTIE